MKILIIDDNPQMREMIRSYLQEFSGEIRECADGAGALSAYRDFLPDFVLMDWQMKIMDGLAATREILSSFPNAYILLITQFDDAELRATAFETGVRGFVSKDDLLALRRFLREAAA
jgi:DNA-binding NarL/FixJ family response regulator